MLSSTKPMRICARGVCRLAMVAAFLLGLTATALAARLPMTLEELVAVSDEIVAVKVIESKSHAYNRQIVTTSRFQVIDTFKGKMTGTQEITYLGGQVGPLVMAVPDIPRLNKDEQAVLFLSNPTKRLSKDRQKNYNMSSPMVNGYSIVGGPQGKLSIVGAESSSSTAKSAAIDSSAKVTRISGLDGAGDKAQEANSYAAFSASLRGVVSAHQKKSLEKGGLKEIAGINGKFAVPERSSDPVIRAYDPLPSMAYMSKAELDAAMEKVWADQAAKQQGSQPKADEKPGTGSTNKPAPK